MVRTFTGSLGFALASVGTAAAIALSSATPALGANQALMLNGIGGAALPDVVMSQVLAGAFANYNRVNVPWPMQANPVTGQDSLFLTESVAIGVDNLDAAIKDALTKVGPGEHVTVVGLSAGSLVADDELKRLLADPNAPDKSKLNFVVIADSSRNNFNKNRYDNILKYQYHPPVETKYDTVVVVKEYDGFADFPDRLWNIVAVVNAYAGEILNHVPSVFTDLSTVPAHNITVKTNSLGGVTTTYFVPSENLPLVELLPFLAPQEAELRKIVDAGYIRNDPTSAAVTPAAAVANTVETPAVTARAVSPEAAPEAIAPVVEVSEKAPAPAAEPVATPAQAVEPAADDVPALEEAPAPLSKDAADAAVEGAPRSSGRRAPATTRTSEDSGVAKRTTVNPPRSSAASRANKQPAA